ncbi:WD40 repeat domain-containing protein [Nonomuraea turcica]|uniref:WD40 repeat domain-containing protein n=1 Tax=Nonomuraea sp. G32 TaxID=3067274 RepID=UPI00273B255B|nr:WD40 repeat domain-containing protein [Nonomuraea sp. G32]MDP4501050.1 WD40 repeat domain-containing protein [Nonomuraea sp. G32]
MKPLTAKGPEVLDNGGHSDVLGVAFGELDGKTIAVSAGAEGKVRFWSLPDFTSVAPPVEGTGVFGLGRDVLITSGDEVYVWDLAGRRVVMRTAKPAGISLHGDHLYVSDRRTIRVWNTRTRAWTGSHKIRGAVEFAVGRVGGRTILVTGGHQKPFQRWDLATDRRIGEGFISGGHSPERVGRLQIVDGRLHYGTAYGVYATELAAPDMRAPEIHREISPRDAPFFDDAHGLAPSVAFDELVAVGERSFAWGDGTRSVAGVINLFGLFRRERLRGHNAGITALAAGTLDGKQVLLSGSDDNTVRLWDVENEKQLGSSPANTIHGADHLAISDGTRVVATEDVGAMRVWDLTTGRLDGDPRTGPAHIMSVGTATIDGTPVAITGHLPQESEPAITRTWDLTTSAEPESDFGAPASKTGVGQFVQVGDRLVGVAGTEVITWQLDNKVPDGRLTLDAETVRLGLIHGEPVAVAFNNGWGDPVLASQHPKQFSIWDVTTKRQISAFRLEPASYKFTIAHVGMYGCAPAIVVTGEKSSWIRFLDPLTGRDLAEPFTLPNTVFSVDGIGTAHNHLIARLTIDRDGGNQTQLWDLSTRTALSEPLPEIKSKAFAVSTEAAVMTGPDEQLLLWRLTP